MSYTIPTKLALKIVEQKTGKSVVDYSGLHSPVIKAIRRFAKDHPEADFDRRYSGSLCKRIIRSVSETYIRMLADKYILDWLGENRLDLSDIGGALRVGIANIIIAESTTEERISDDK